MLPKRSPAPIFSLPFSFARHPARAAGRYFDRAIPQQPIDISTGLARLAGIDGFARSIMIGVLPLIALQAFGSKDIIAALYFASSLFTLVFTMNIGLLELLLRRRMLMVLSGLLLIGSVLFFYTSSASFFALGVGMRAAGASIFAVCMSLYVMDHIAKADMTRNESLRMCYTGATWLIGPSLGIWLFENGNTTIVFGLAILASLATLAYFMRLPLGNASAALTTKQQSQNPLRLAAHFARQPRLRISYWITLSRACFWVTLFVYGPIYIVEAALPLWISGILLSAVSGLLLFSPIVQRLADRFGTRQILIVSSTLVGGSSVALGLLGEPQPIGLLFWTTGAIGTAAMDVLVNIPFMRMVRPRERTEMTTIYTTWREGSSLLTQGLIFLTLLVAPFWVFYLLLGLMQFSCAICTSFLPRRL